MGEILSRRHVTVIEIMVTESSLYSDVSTLKGASKLYEKETFFKVPIDVSSSCMYYCTFRM